MDQSTTRPLSDAGAQLRAAIAEEQATSIPIPRHVELGLVLELIDGVCALELELAALHEASTPADGAPLRD